MKTKLPDWRSDKAVQAFWEHHDFAEVEHLFKRVEARFPKPRKRLVSLRVGESTLAALRAVANRKGIGYLTLARMWITERLGREIQQLHPRSAAHR